MIRLDRRFFDKIYNIQIDDKQKKELVQHCLNEKVSSKVGFYNLPKLMKPVLKEIRSFVKSLPAEIDTFLLIGVGGSALGPQTIDEALRTSKTKKKFICLDNTDPDVLNDVLDTINLEKTVVNVVSKSGSTLETMVNFSVIHDVFYSKLKEKSYQHYVFTTDPENSCLKDYAEEHNVKCFYIPPNVGGRFSVLSPVGLLMTEFMGYNGTKLLNGAERIISSFFDDTDPQAKNDLLDYTLLKFHAFRNDHKSVSVMMPYSSKLAHFSAWYKQLWGESLGKRTDLDGANIYVGQTPVAAVGSVDQHSILQYLIEGPKSAIMTFIKINKRVSIHTVEHPLLNTMFSNTNIGNLNNKQLNASAEALANEGRPSLILEIETLNETSLGQLFIFFEFVTSVWGKLLNINPYDQPGVELGKKLLKISIGHNK